MTPESPADASGDRVRVFISAKSADYEYAALVHRRLSEAGISAFFSRESLPELGIADYRREIDRALDEADHLIVVTSSLAHVQAPWVEAEWGFFVSEKRSGRKPGNLVTMVVGALKPADLPPSLRYYEVIPFDPATLDRILRYVREPSTRTLVVAPSPPSISPRAVFRESGTIGGPPEVHMLAGLSDDVVATGGLDGALRLYDTRTRMRIATLGSARYWQARHESLVTALVCSWDGRLLAAGHFDGRIHVWDIAAEKEIEGAWSHEWAISGLVFSPDSQGLISASKDGVVKCWSLSSRPPAFTELSSHRMPAPVISMASAPEKGWLVSGLINTTNRRCLIQVADGLNPERTLASIGFPENFTLLALSRGCRFIATGGKDGRVQAFDFDSVVRGIERGDSPTSLPLQKDLQFHKRPIAAMAFFPDEGRLATCATDSNLVVWEVRSGAPLFKAKGTTGERFASVAVLGLGTVLAGALVDGRVRLWQLD